MLKTWWEDFRDAFTSKLHFRGNMKKIIIFQVVENREETCNQASEYLWYIAGLSSWLSFDYLPKLFLLDILVSGMTAPLRNLSKLQSWQASFISHFKLFSHKMFYHQTLSIISLNICPIYPFLLNLTLWHNLASDSSKSLLVLLKTAC